MYIMMYEETRKFCLLIRDNIKVFGIFCSHRNFSFGLVTTLSLMVIDAEESRSLIARNIFLCFTGRFTEFSDSELPNSAVIGVVYRLLINLTSAVWAMMRSRFVKVCEVESGGFWISPFSGG